MFVYRVYGYISANSLDSTSVQKVGGQSIGRKLLCPLDGRFIPHAAELKRRQFKISYECKG